VVACPPFREPCTLGPLVEALRQAVGRLRDLGLSGLAGSLRPLFPEWSADLPPAPEPLADPTAATVLNGQLYVAESTDAFTLSPGQSQTVAVTMDSSAVSQPGAYAAKLTIGTDSPYQFAPIGVAMQANPLAARSRVAGTVTDASTGNPIAGATVEICT
jgi:hypothetical protein